MERRALNLAIASAFMALPLTASGPPKVEVYFEGLMAFVETNEVDTKPTTLDALVYDAERDFGDQLPNIIMDVIAHTYPTHKAFIALQYGTWDGSGCALKGPGQKLAVPGDGIIENVVGYPLCQNIDCDIRPFTIDIGTPGTLTKFRLGSLVDSDDLIEDCDNPEYRKLRGGLIGADPQLKARLRIANAMTIEARPLRNTVGKYVNFGYRQMEGGIETPLGGSCVPTSNSVNLLGEEVVATGTGSVKIALKDVGNCSILPDSSGLIRLRILNVTTHRILQSHYESFYHFYDLAPAPCSADDKNFPRPCDLDPMAGDPKCPQFLLLED